METFKRRQFLFLWILVPPSPIKFPGGGGFLSSASPAKSPGGGGFLSSASPDLAPKGEGVLYLASSAFVCSNGGGCDLAPAIDLSVAGETRPCSDVGSPGGGDDAGSYLEVGRIARCRWIDQVYEFLVVRLFLMMLYAVLVNICPLLP
ncbi:hypothetical protein F2Q69_00003609 [Brassica cretica]|uniref:Uncharacterized protein n=1 Tax=Brassica cretica TaxID=69181 RepID=A0A8S9NZU8_BRACR|nr:hypothetical protein F2Q69_00003609 [Brassica cretica]